MHRALLSLSAASAFLVLGPQTGAQEVRCLLGEGLPLPGVPGHVVSSISNTASNGRGGWACSTNTSDGVTTLSHVWGAAEFGGVGGPLQTEGTIGTFEQTSFESFFGIDDFGTVAYGPTTTDTVSGATGLDSVWFGSAPVATEGEPIPSLAGKVWRYGSRPGVTRGGDVFWAGGINDAVSGANEGEGLFYGFGATPLLKTGDTPLGAPGAIDSSGITFSYRFSAYGTHYITDTELGLASSVDTIMVIDGSALVLGGSLVQEGTALPASIGGLPGELWSSFDYFGINENFDYMITGSTSGGASATNEFILKNGVIAVREGDVVDGETLTGAMEGAAMNENGEIAFVWDVVSGTSDVEALYFEDQLLLKEGDTVDITGDGVPDPGAIVSGFTGIESVSLGPDRVIYFTADVDTMGTSSTTDDVECLFAATPAAQPDFVACPVTISTTLGADQSMFLDAGPAGAGAFYLVGGTISGTAPGIPYGGFVIPLNPDFYTNLTLNKPNVAPLVNTFGNLDVNGSALAEWRLPAGALPTLAGITANHAYVVLDALTLLPTYVSTPTTLEFTP